MASKEPPRTYQIGTARGGADGSADGATVLLSGEGQVCRALALLSATGVTLTLLRLKLGDLPPADVAEVLLNACGPDMMCERLADGSWFLMLIDVPGAEPVDAAHLREVLLAELARRDDLPPVDPRIFAIRHSAAEIVNPQELVAELVHLDRVSLGG
jgi:hypothetical protein